ncbi:MAG: hypothetical protein HYY93_11620 [Planctomycetes bacterium]|nr:hypothetical protein [Planctomycetota bacterium]
MIHGRAWTGALAALALWAGGLASVVRAEDEAVKVCLAFTIPDGKSEAVQAAVEKIPGVTDVSVEKSTVCFTVEEEQKVTLSQVEKAVEGAAGKESRLDRSTTTLGGTVEIDCAGLNKEATDAAVKAIGETSGVEKVEKTSTGHLMVKCASPKGASLADIEKAVMSATKSSEGWTVKDLTWTGPKKSGKKGGHG